jgi:lipoprotein-anchoring transpeptidase ErfK/SrfK
MIAKGNFKTVKEEAAGCSFQPPRQHGAGKHETVIVTARVFDGVNRQLPALTSGGWRRFRRFAGRTAVLVALLFANHLAAQPLVSATPNEQVMRAQLFLDGSDFKPGVIDGHWGEFMRKALIRYEEAQGKSGAHFGKTAPDQFDLPFDESRPLLTSYTFSPNDQNFIGHVPASHAQQARQQSLPYRDFLELLGEKFHAKGDFLRQLNPGYDWRKAKPGDVVKVPNVIKPFDLKEAIDLQKQTDAAEKSDSVPTEDKKPANERLALFASVSEKILELKQGDKLVGSYPITPGSKSLPAPIGEWFVKGFTWMPTFRWDEAMLEHGQRSGHYYELPSGPNNPVGIIWMELNHKGSGLHGTDAPETIGRTTSHGCIRLSNWDALDLATKVLPGVHITIR